MTACAFVLANAVACASVSVKRPNSSRYDPTAGTGDDVGITYYEPMFLLVVSCDEHGNTKAEIKTAPDYSQPRVVSWSNGFFTSPKVAATLADGWRLDAFNTEVTSQAGAVLTGAGDLATGIAGIGALFAIPPEGAASELVAGGEKVLPGLYRIDWSKADGQSKWLISLATSNTPCVKKDSTPPKT
jgi:hypothetical protein